MSSYLFGVEQKNTDMIKLKLFCDEAYFGKWLYIGILIIPEKRETEILTTLLNKRCGHPDKNKAWGKCDTECQWHNRNNTEVHYAKIDSKDKFYIAERWISYLVNDTEDIYFYVLGLDLSKLDKTQFGNHKHDKNIYNRFFRTAILKSVKSYFHRYNSIIIREVYHDNSSELEGHDYFPWHSIFYIDNRDDKVTLGTDKIIFIDSDHRKSGNSYSHFIQFIDLILGCIGNCLDHTSSNNEKEVIAEKCLPRIERLIEKPNNKNSRYNYVGRQKIEFFPKHVLRNTDDRTLEYYYKRMNSFYTKRIIKLKNKNQAVLF
jgi:hypothetical protein